MDEQRIYGQQDDFYNDVPLKKEPMPVPVPEGIPAGQPITPPMAPQPIAPLPVNPIPPMQGIGAQPIAAEQPPLPKEDGQPQAPTGTVYNPAAPTFPTYAPQTYTPTPVPVQSEPLPPMEPQLAPPPYTQVTQPVYGSPIPAPAPAAGTPFGGNFAQQANPTVKDDNFHHIFDNEQETGGKKAKKKKKVWPLITVLVILLALGVAAAFNTQLVKMPDGGTNVRFFSWEFVLSKGNTAEQNLPDPLDLPSNGTDVMPIQNAEDSEGVLSITQISKKVKPSVVGIVSESLGYNGGSSGTGSGIISTADGYIITNQHVIDRADKVTVVMQDGEKYAAVVVGSDKKTDIAVLKIDASGLPPAEFGNSDQLEDGDLAVAIGNPFGMELQGTVTAGIISAINRNIVIDDRTMTLIQTDTTINPGNSGGPLINKYGQVIGINSIKLGNTNFEGLGFAIPSNVVQPIVKELMETGAIRGRPVIGISGTVLTEAQANYYDIPKGVYVNEVNPNADAAKKGLRAGDIIVGIGGKTIETLVEMNDIKDKKNIGEEIALKIFRNGQYNEFTIVLMDENKLAEQGNAFQPENPFAP